MGPPVPSPVGMFYWFGPPIVELEGLTPLSEDGTIISRLSSCGFTYLIPLPFIEAKGPKLFVFLWPVWGGSCDISLMFGPLAPEAFPDPCMFAFC